MMIINVVCGLRLGFVVEKVWILDHEMKWMKYGFSVDINLNMSEFFGLNFVKEPTVLSHNML